MFFIQKDKLLSRQNRTALLRFALGTGPKPMLDKHIYLFLCPCYSTRKESAGVDQNHAGVNAKELSSMHDCKTLLRLMPCSIS